MEIIKLRITYCFNINIIHTIVACYYYIIYWNLNETNKKKTQQKMNINLLSCWIFVENCIQIIAFVNGIIKYSNKYYTHMYTIFRLNKMKLKKGKIK